MEAPSGLWIRLGLLLRPTWSKFFLILVMYPLVFLTIGVAIISLEETNRMLIFSLLFCVLISYVIACFIHQHYVSREKSLKSVYITFSILSAAWILLGVGVGFIKDLCCAA
jgi:hypothetical protein